MRCLGQWNAYVARGATDEDRGARLAEVPEALRAMVDSHVRTFSTLRAKVANEDRKVNDYARRRTSR